MELRELLGGKISKYLRYGFLNKIGGKSCQIWIPENLDLLTWISSETRLSFIFDHLGAGHCQISAFYTVKLFYHGMAILRGTMGSLRAVECRVYIPKGYQASRQICMYASSGFKQSTAGGEHFGP